MSTDPSDLKSVFFDEANEHLATMEATLLELENKPGDRELLNQIFRAAHSIKGGCGFFGFDDLLRFTHALEGLLHLLRDGDVLFEPPLADLLLRATDSLGMLVVAAERGHPAPASLEALLLEIEAATDHGEPIAAPVSSSQLGGWVELEGLAAPASEALNRMTVHSPETAKLKTVRVLFAPGPNLFREGMDPLLVVRDILELGEVKDVTLDPSAIPDLDALDPETCHLAWTVTLETARSETEIRDIFAFVEDTSRIELAWLDAPATAAPESAPAASSSVIESSEILTSAAPVNGPTSAAAAPRPTSVPARAAKRAASAERSSVRVDTAKIDRLIDLVGELVIAQSMVTSALNDVGSPGAAERLRDAVLAMDRNTKELQDRVMAVRMLPVGSVFNRFPRTVRDLSAALGKRANLVIVGDEIELDKGMVEKLADPLTHLVCNAMDHGLEPPDERRAAGKAEEGTITVAAVHQGGSVVIEVADDGRGLPLDKIRSKARALGLWPRDVEPTVEDLHAIIFAPGFSTKDEVTDLSGRGVGMDVVKRNVEALNGTITFTSEPGKGSRMRIRLPLTMAIIDGLTLRVGEQVFVLPLIDVVESLRPTRGQHQTILGRGEVVRVRNQAMPLVRLHDVLGIPGAERDPCQALVCIVETRTTPVGLLVDEILGQAQVVVKTLETNFRRVEGIMGATILGDGRVALILDVQAIARKATASGYERQERESIHGAAGHAA